MTRLIRPFRQDLSGRFEGTTNSIGKSRLRWFRAPQNLSLFELRQYIYHICDQDEDFPKEFLYLRSVGRCLTKVKPHQEIDLKVKNFRPPIVSPSSSLFITIVSLLDIGTGGRWMCPFDLNVS